MRIATVLFDLDGTLCDTAPDLSWALDRVRAERGLEPLPYAQLRAVVSHGAGAMIEAGFQVRAGEPEFAHLRQRLLTLYAENIARFTGVFPGMDEVLAWLEERRLPWGIVTNKPGYLTLPLLQQLGLAQRAACIVSGDTLPQRKPDPAPLLLACRQAGSTPAACVYVGDAACDVNAGRAAGMQTAVALFGYLGAHDQPATWGADVLLAQPRDLIPWLQEKI